MNILTSRIHAVTPTGSMVDDLRRYTSTDPAKLAARDALLTSLVTVESARLRAQFTDPVRPEYMAEFHTLEAEWISQHNAFMNA